MGQRKIAIITWQFARRVFGCICVTSGLMFPVRNTLAMEIYQHALYRSEESGVFIYFYLLSCSLWCVQTIGTLRPECFICLFVNCTNFLLSLCRIVWMNWTYKMLVRYNLSSVCLRASLFSHLLRYMGMWVDSFPIYLLMFVRIQT